MARSPKAAVQVLAPVLPLGGSLGSASEDLVRWPTWRVALYTPCLPLLFAHAQTEPGASLRQVLQAWGRPWVERAVVQPAGKARMPTWKSLWV